MIRAENFFTPEEQVRIETAVRAAEEQTCGEIVPLVVTASDDYARAEVIAGGSFAMALALVIGWLWGSSSEWVFASAFLVLFLPCCRLIRLFPALRRRLLPRVEIDQAVGERAINSFYRQGLYRTRDATGILIMISLLEHRVVILADRGINEKVPPHTWDEIVAIVIAGLRNGTPCDSLCHAITRCGEILSERFPRRNDDLDELPNYITEDGPASPPRMDKSHNS